MWFENSTGVVKTMNFHYKMMDRTHTFTSPYFSDITENDKHEKKDNCIEKWKREALKPDDLALNPGSAIYQLCDLEPVAYIFWLHFPHR